MKIIIVWLIICVIWSSTWFFIKLGLQDLPPLSFAGIRFIVAFVVISLIIWKKNTPLPRSRHDWLLIAGTGVLTFGINYGLIFWSEQFISSGLAAVLNATLPAFGLVLAPIHLKEKVTALKTAAIVLGLCGVAVIFFDQLKISGWLSFLASVGVVVGSIAGAYSSVLVKAFGNRLDPAILISGQTFFGLIPLCLAGFMTEGNPFGFRWSATALISVLYLALVGSITGFWLYYWLLQQIQATKAILVCLVIPVLAVFIGTVFLHESLEWKAVAGSLLVLSGVGLIFAPTKQERKVLFDRITLYLKRKQLPEG